MPRICLFGCHTAGLKLHVFPNPEKDLERFKTWITIVKSYLKTPDDYEFYRTKRVCDKHFTENHKLRNNRISVDAIPTLHLGHSSQMENTAAHELPPPSMQTQAQSLPCDSASAISTVVNMDHDYCLPAIKVAVKHLSASRKRMPSTHINKLKTSRRLIKYLRSEVCRLRKNVKSYNNRLRNAEKMSDTAAFTRVTRNMSSSAKIFTEMQFRETARKPKARRFKLEEKVLALSLYKKSPKGYPLLSKMFTLPSSKSLKRLLSDIELKTGINQMVFDKMKKTVQEMQRDDRLCTLIFDEMSLTPNVLYDASKDELKGFTDDHKIADHALVFMIKGIVSNYKQPVAYYFTNSLKKYQLKEKIKEVLKAVQNTGLIVLCTICDQSTVNVSAINELVGEAKQKSLKKGKEWRHDYFEVNNKQIIPLYDAPHLLKGLRNNLLTKKMIYTDFDDENKEKYVKWEYLQMLYKADKSFGELRCLQKITEEHIDPTKIKKMRVKTAAQIFSHSVAVATEHLTARGQLPEESRMLIPIFLLIDNVFDSLNVSTYHVPNGKIYKGPVKRTSPHHELWKKAKKTFKTIKFVQVKKEGDKVRVLEKNTPSVTNFIKTIEGMEVLWKILSQKYKINAMLTRHFNQDPVENFFGNIRSLGVRNTAPNSVNFEGAFKALLLNNYNSPHSIGANCEEDNNTSLQTLHFFANEKIKETPDISKETIVINDEILLSHEHTEDNGQRNYVCGWVLTKCLQNISKSCEICKINLLGEKTQRNAYIRAKEYCENKKLLCYPAQNVDEYFHELQNIVNGYLKKNVHTKMLKESILFISNMLIEHPFTCEIHKEKLKRMFDNKAVNVIIYSWCRSINRIISGKIMYEGDDETKNYALAYHKKHVKTKK